MCIYSKELGQFHILDDSSDILFNEKVQTISWNFWFQKWTKDFKLFPKYARFSNIFLKNATIIKMLNCQFDNEKKYVFWNVSELIGFENVDNRIVNVKAMSKLRNGRKVNIYCITLIWAGFMHVMRQSGWGSDSSFALDAQLVSKRTNERASDSVLLVCFWWMNAPNIHISCWMCPTSRRNRIIAVTRCTRKMKKRQ